MKKTLLSTFFTLLMAVVLIAQTTIEPNPASAAVEADALDVSAHSTVKNTGDKEEEYRWTRTIVEMTEGWETAVCDKNFCYIPEVESEVFSLGGGEEDILDVHVYPYGVEGQAKIEVSLVNTSTNEEVAKGVYLFNMDATGTLEAFRTDLVVYPNPATDAFQISSSVDIARLEVYNAIGKLVGNFNYQQGERYSVMNYPQGFYFIKVLNRKQETVSVQRLQKL